MTQSKGHVTLWAEAHKGKLPNHPVKSGVHRHSGCRDMMVLFFYVTLQDHLIKAFNNFMMRSHETD